MLSSLGCSGGGGGGGPSVPPADNTPPTVISITPAADATGVAVGTTLTATFSEAMDPATLTTAFVLADSNGIAAPGAVSYSGTTATFAPLSDLAYSTVYTARINLEAKDLAGNKMSYDMLWRFTTAAKTPQPGGLSALPGFSSGQRVITVSWDMQLDASIGYNLYWGTSPGVTKSNGNKVALGPLVPSYVHANVTGGTTYYYVVTATHVGNGESDESAEVSATPPFSTAITRYSSDGAFSWQRGVNGSVVGAALATHADGSAYVTGNFSCTVTFGAGESGESIVTQPSCSIASDGPPEMFLARYRADGTLAWVRQTQDSLVRQPRALTVLSDGSVIVAGSYWVRMTLGPGEPNQTTLACDNASCVFVARYASSGALLWAKRAVGNEIIAGPEARGVAALADDSVVLTGSFFRTITFNPGDPGAIALNTVASCLTNDFDVFVARYTAEGAVSWAKRAGGCSWEEGLAVAALPGDAVAITGRFSSSATFGPGEANQTVLTSDYTQFATYDLFVASYGTIAGNLQWARAAHSQDVDDIGSGTSVIGADGLAVTGSLGGTTTFGTGEPNETTLSATAFLARYNTSNGALAWALGIVGDFIPSAVASAPQGAATVVGSLGSSATLGSAAPPSTLVTTPYRDILIARYDASGSLAWVKRVERGPSTGQAISVFSDGSTIVLGNMYSP